VYETKPTLAAVPGTSNHGWGTAVDLCGGVERFDTDEHAWVVEHGPSYGWIHPSWAAAGGSRPEPWHFEYLA
jgi:LAS superfamily LD-carboxypeptidase LdcB